MAKKNFTYDDDDDDDNSIPKMKKKNTSINVYFWSNLVTLLDIYHHHQFKYIKVF